MHWVPWLFSFCGNHTFFSLWQASLIDLNTLRGHLTNQWLATSRQENLADFASAEVRREEIKKSHFCFIRKCRDWHVFRREQLEVWICQQWSPLSPGRISRGLAQLEVQLWWMSPLWHCGLWQAPVLTQTGRIYGNGSRVLRRMVADHCLSHAAIRWNPAGLNLKQMCPINLQVSLGRLMKTNGQTVKGPIHPPSFPL